MTQEAVEVSDDLLSLLEDVRSQRTRIGKVTEPTAARALSELSGTGLSLTEDLIAYFVQFRQYVAESLEDVDGRLTALEADGGADKPLLSRDEASMLLTLCNMCEAFSRVIRDTSASIADEAREKLDETDALVEQVRAWIEENLDPDEVGSDDADGEDELLESDSDETEEPN